MQHARELKLKQATICVAKLFIVHCSMFFAFWILDVDFCILNFEFWMYTLWLDMYHEWWIMIDMNMQTVTWISTWFLSYDYLISCLYLRFICNFHFISMIYELWSNVHVTYWNWILVKMFWFFISYDIYIVPRRT